MSDSDQPDAWQKWVARHKGRPRSYHDNYGNSIPDDVVEATRVRSVEADLDWEIDFTDFLKSLPEMQRLAIQKRLDGIPLNAAERMALSRAKDDVAKWLEIRTQEMAPEK